MSVPTLKIFIYLRESARTSVWGGGGGRGEEDRRERENLTPS